MQQSCKKLQTPNTLGSNEKIETFLTVTEKTRPEIQIVLSDLRTQLIKNDFVDYFLNNQGQPLWDKATMLQGTNMKAAKVNCLIPVKSLVTDEITAFIQCNNINQEGFVFKTYNKKIIEKQFYAARRSTNKYMKDFSVFLYFENKLFGHNQIKLKDGILSLDTNNISNSNNSSPVTPDDPCVGGGGSGGGGTGHWEEHCARYYCSICGGRDPACPLGGSWIVCAPVFVLDTPCGGGGSGGGGYGGGGSGGGGGGLGDPCPTPNSNWYLVSPDSADPCPYTLSAADIAIFNQLDAEDAEANNILSNLDCQGTRMNGGNPSFPGTKEHWIIQLDYLTKNPLAEREYAIPFSGATGGRGQADLVNKLTNEIFEIKPDNATGQTQGLIEVQNYVTKANLSCPATGISFPPGWHAGIYYPPTVLPTLDPTKSLVTRLHANGVIVYETVDNNTNPQPSPIVVPADILTKLSYLVDRLRQHVSDADRIIAEFLRKPENADLVNYFKTAAIGAAVAIVVGTIAEDFVTLGGGIWDDLATLQLAYRIIRFAWAL